MVSWDYFIGAPASSNTDFPAIVWLVMQIDSLSPPRGLPQPVLGTVMLILLLRAKTNWNFGNLQTRKAEHSNRFWVNLISKHLVDAFGPINPTPQVGMFSSPKSSYWLWDFGEPLSLFFSLSFGQVPWGIGLIHSSPVSQTMRLLVLIAAVSLLILQGVYNYWNRSSTFCCTLSLRSNEIPVQSQDGTWFLIKSPSGHSQELGQED